MTAEIAYERRLHCTFCGKGTDEVRKLIAGPNVFICNECVALCQAIVDEEAPGDAGKLSQGQETAVRAIVTEMLATMFEGADSRIREAMAERDERSSQSLRDLLDRTTAVAGSIHLDAAGNITGFSRNPEAQTEANERLTSALQEVTGLVGKEAADRKALELPIGGPA